jgi:hypothetical protein
MWENLSPADIERAKGELKVQRDAILQRHAAELLALDTDQSELDTLDRLITAFLQTRDGAATEPAPEPAPAPEPPPAAAEQEAAPDEPPPIADPPAAEPPAPPAISATGEKPLPPRQATRRDYAGTNFDTFSKAVSKLL